MEALSKAASVASVASFPNRFDATTVDIIAVYKDGEDSGLKGLFESFKTARVLAFSCNSGHERPNDEENKQIEFRRQRIAAGEHEAAKELLETISSYRRAQKERKIPILFLARNTESIIEKALEIAKDSGLYASKGTRSYRSIFDSTYGVVVLPRISNHNPPLASGTFRWLGIEKWTRRKNMKTSRRYSTVETLMDQARRWKRFWQEFGLPIAQVTACFILGNYLLGIRRNSGQTVKSYMNPNDTATRPVWPCALPEQHSRYASFGYCETKAHKLLPSSLLHPSATVFVLAVLGYMIAIMTYYQNHRHHKYQHRIFLLGSLLGIVYALCLRSQNTVLISTISVILNSMTLSLIISTVGHFTWEAAFPSDVERVFRRLNTWAPRLNHDEKD